VSALRIVLIVLLLSGGVGATLLLAPRAIDSLHARPRAQTTARQHRGDTPVKKHEARRRAIRGHDRSARPARHGEGPIAAPASRHASGPLDLNGLKLALVVAAEIALGVLVVGGVLGVLVIRRVRRRSRREYALFELHLSTHDEAKPQDLEDMVESVAGVIHAFPGDRARNGQPFVALELICGAGHGGTEWSINVRCEPASVRALDAAISAAYPDVRLGRRHAEAPVPRPGRLRVPGYVMRFRKERSFVYPLIAPDEALASPPLEHIARTQVSLQGPSVVRFRLTPTPSFFEELARKLYKRHENRLVRQERWGLPGGGLWSTLNRAEMGNAQRTQNRSLFWLEVVVAADSAQACKTLAAAVQARRGENRLHRRWMHVRQNLYRRRFPDALGPLLPSFRSLVSAAEAAHLLALPSARMKGVPVRRLTLPRIPAPPEAMRGTDLADAQAPTVSAVEPSAGLAVEEIASSR
jgi:hypothetical protein